MKRIHYILLGYCALAAVLTSCEKVSPIGILVSGTGVEDRVKMSHIYFQQHKGETFKALTASEDADEYTFLVGSDSHLTDDPGRMDEMFKIGLDNNDLLYTHLGDIADTKAEYYITLDKSIQRAKKNYAEKYFQKYAFEGEDEYQYIVYEDTINEAYYDDTNDVPLPFYPVVGNHDITHNGWALWSNIFHSSFYEIDVLVVDPENIDIKVDHLIFLDSASGTLGKTQIDLINQGVLDGKYSDGSSIYRYTFVFSHTNIFRPQFFEFASTFTREETFFLLDQFEEWNVTGVFLGHVHTWDERDFNGVHYITMDSMCEKNNPEPGNYLIRVNVGEDGVELEPVKMNYTPKKKK